MGMTKIAAAVLGYKSCVAFKSPVSRNSEKCEHSILYCNCVELNETSETSLRFFLRISALTYFPQFLFLFLCNRYQNSRTISLSINQSRLYHAYYNFTHVIAKEKYFYFWEAFKLQLEGCVHIVLSWIATKS